MTIALFLTILTSGAIIAGLMTEALKKTFDNAEIKYSPNIIALITSIVVGGGGTAVVYILAKIPFTVENVVCLVVMIVLMWIGAMVGYDKLVQTVKQILGE